MTFKALARFAAWMGVIALAAASLTPAERMIRTNLSGLIEHLIAYLLVGLAFIVGYRIWRGWRIALALSAYAAFLEIGQGFVPGRHPGLLDWLAGTVGAGLALAAARWFVNKRVP